MQLKELQPENQRLRTELNEAQQSIASSSRHIFPAYIPCIYSLPIYPIYPIYPAYLPIYPAYLL